MVLDDPFDDPKGFVAPSRSPSPPTTAINDRIEDDVDVFDDQGKTEEEIAEELAAKEARSRADVLAMVGDSACCHRSHHAAHRGLQFATPTKRHQTTCSLCVG